MEITNASPPIVGVPLLEECQDGPPSYIGCLARRLKAGIRCFSISEVSAKLKVKAKIMINVKDPCILSPAHCLWIKISHILWIIVLR